MDNFIKVSNANELNKIFDSAQDKLIILMFYTKNNPECRRAYNFFEKIAMNHTITLFCFIDTDKFDGESRYVTNINNMPKFDCFFMGNSIGTASVSTEKEIEQLVMYGEQYMMNYNNTKNQMNQNMSSMPKQNMQMVGQMPQLNMMQIQQQLLNTAQIQNPQYFQYLMNNPLALQQAVQKQYQTLQQQQLLQQQLLQQQMMQQSHTMQPTMTMNPMAQTMMPQMNIPSAGQTSQLNPGAAMASSPNSVIPTFQQMQQMFQIFQMMQQMGVLNTPGQFGQNSPEIISDVNKVSNLNPTNVTMGNTIHIPNTPTTPNTSNISGDPENTIVLPNGDKLIPLANGKYGLIKKN